MPEGQAVAAAGAAQQPQQQGTTWAVVKGFLFRMAIIYFVSSLIRGWRQQPASPGSHGNQSDQLGAPGGSGYRPSQNLFARGTEMDLYVYISENHRFRDFDDSKALFWMLPNVVYGDWKGGLNGDGTFTKDGEIQCTENLQNNGSIYMHVYFVKAGKSPDPQSVDYERQGTVYSSRRLNKYKKKRYRKTQNLLTGKTETNEEELKKIDLGVKAEILSHWHPNLTLNLVDDHTNWVKGSLPPPLDEHVQFDEATGDYYPIVFFNDYWNLMSDYQPINETTQMLNLSVTFAPTSLFKWQLYVSQTMRNRWMSVLGSDIAEESDEDQDSLKQAILDTNPYLLGATIAVSILHTIFEFLAFKNDIQFWRNRKSLEGLSVRSVLFNVFTSLIVLLYIMDNETNFVVRISIGIGLLIELWKVPKVLDIKIDREHKWFGVIPRVRFQDKGSYVESSTKIYDQMAFKYLAWALFPLLGGYAVYSLIYNEHRSWYSFVLSMMYGFLLTFGFIMMTPQLFINYKLKSVAHLPWRMLTYKFLNTFIDDIFAFVIKMPTMYRIGCFRDDIVFLIYVYQRWIYKIDPKRVNEFGTTGDGQIVDENDEHGILAVQNGEIPQSEGAESPEAEHETTAVHSDSTASGDENVRNRKKDKKKKRKRATKKEDVEEDGEEVDDKKSN